MKILTCLSLGLALSATSLLSAQPADHDGPPDGRRGRGPGGPGGPGGRGGGPGMSIVRALDTDKDRELSSAEIANAAASLRTLDTNNDGTVSIEELRARPPRRGGDGDDAPPPPPPPDGDKKGGRRGPGGPGGPGRGGPPMDPVMLALDADKDGALSSAEIDGAPASLAALDANKDGKLTQDELRPLPPSHKE